MLEQNIESNQNRCRLCHGALIFDMHADENICNECGAVIPMYDEFLHSSTCEQKRNNLQPAVETLANNMMYEISLPTFIGQRNVDASGKQINRLHFEKIRKLDRMTLSNDNKIRNMSKAIREIRRIAEILGLKTFVVERATYIYRKAFDQGLIRGRSVSGIAAAALYVACKELAIPYSVYDIESLVSGLSKKNVLRYCKMLLKLMKISLGLPNPVSYVSKIAEKTGLSGRVERKAIMMLSKVGSNSLLVGKKPISIAAAALYLASIQTNERTTQLRIAIAADLTTITIRKRCNEIMQILNEGREEQLVKPTIDTSYENKLVDQTLLLVE